MLLEFDVGKKVGRPGYESKLQSQLALLIALQGAARLKMYSLAYITAASPLPGSSFSADGQVGSNA